MRIVPVPCLKDNYAYLVIDGDIAAIVDPGEAAPVAEAARREGVTLQAIWLTHHHHDHVGGVEELGIAEVVAHVGDRTRAPKVSHPVDEGDVVALGSLRARIIHNPGHTTGAISYVVDDGVTGCVFTGDTLFGAGCGRLFEGTPAMMHASLAKLAALPPETRVYFGHEYTAANLVFAAAAEPDNPAITARAAALRVPSTPSTIADELATNPFVRARDVDELARRRAWKDTFK